MSPSYIVKPDGSLSGGGYMPPALIDTYLPFRPENIGIDLTNPGVAALAPGSSFLDIGAIAAGYSSPPTTWVVDLGSFIRNVTVACGGFRCFFLPFEGDISFDPTTDYSRAINGRRALLVQQFAAVHMQTFRLSGATISDGLNLSSTIAGAAAQVQHFRIEGLRENYYDTGAAVAPITRNDGSQPQFNHPDVIQSYGGPAIMRVSNFFASSDRSLMTLASAGGPVGPNLTELTVKRGHYKQLAHPVFGDQQTYPFYWNQAAGESNAFPLTWRDVYYEHGSGARSVSTAMFPEGDARWNAVVLGRGIVDGAPPADSAYWVPAAAEVGHGKSSPPYAG